VLARAVAALAEAPPVSPVVSMLDAGAGGSTMLETLEAVIDHWGEPQRAAAALAVHPNTVRYRMARLQERCDLDLQDPAQRLAVRLELARLRQVGRPVSAGG
jgi:DNA-binding PucR family transcriptional regulator